MTNSIDADPGNIKIICFIDKCTFFLIEGSRSKTFVIRAIKFRIQHPQKVNVSTGINEEEVIGCLFIDSSLNGEMTVD